MRQSFQVVFILVFVLLLGLAVAFYTLFYSSLLGLRASRLEIILFAAVLVLYIVVLRMTRKLLGKSRAFGYASSIKRMMALIVDLFLWNSLVFFAFALRGLFHPLGYVEGFALDFRYVLSHGWVLLSVQALILLWIGVWRALLEFLGKRSIGTKLFDLQPRPVEDEYKRLTLGRALLRAVVRIPVLYLWPLALLVTLADPKRRWLHDRVGRSVVLDLDQLRLEAV